MVVAVAFFILVAISTAGAAWLIWNFGEAQIRKPALACMVVTICGLAVFAAAMRGQDAEQISDFEAASKLAGPMESDSAYHIVQRDVFGWPQQAEWRGVSGKKTKPD